MPWVLILCVLTGVCRMKAGDGEPGGAPAGIAASSGEDALFGDMPEVIGAALHEQTLAEAPASVTVVTAEEIRRYGYRTLADVLASVRGFTVTNSHIEYSSGVRGIAVPGDYNTCFLVMINGHPMTEITGNSSNLFGEDFGLDMEVVERIEIIRGPSSALYGSNGILATINIVTVTPVESPGAQAGTETSAGGPQKAAFLTSLNLGGGANLLIEGAGFFTGGNNLNAPAFNSGSGSSMANHVDGESGYHTFLNLVWGAWDFTAYFNNDLERTPILGPTTQFNDSGQFLRTARNFVSAAYTHAYAGGDALRWEIDYDQFRWKDRYDYLEPFGILDNRDDAYGDWISSQLTYTHPVAGVGPLTLGLSAKLELRNEVLNLDVSPDQAINLDISHPDRAGALFAHQEWNLSAKWTAYLGARLDASQNYGSFVSPQLALVFQPTRKTSYKLVYGRPFRTPSVYEAFYADGIDQIANPHLRPETAEAIEVSAERKIGKSTYALVNAYYYSLGSVIQAVWISSTNVQYQNSDRRWSRGVDFEFGGHVQPWLETTASLSLDRTWDEAGHDQLPNAPAEMVKFRAAIPLYRDKVYLSGDFQYLSSRLTSSQALTRPVALVNATLSTNKLAHGFDLIAGVRNAINWSYSDPISLPLDSLADQIPVEGRTAFVRLIWRHGE